MTDHLGRKSRCKWNRKQHGSSTTLLVKPDTQEELELYGYDK